MSLDSASYPALWGIYTATQGDLLPEYVLPVLWGESNFTPSAVNADHYGLNQVMGDTLRNQGIDPVAYGQWPASQQLTRIVKPSFVALIKTYGPMRSGTRLYQSNFLPASLKYAFNFEDVICGKNGPYAYAWSGNPTLDIGNKKYITVGDIATRVGNQAADPHVVTAIAYSYLPSSKPVAATAASIPYPHGPSNPVYGSDYTPDGKYNPNLYNSNQSSSFNTFLLFAAAMGITGAGFYYLHDKGQLPRFLGGRLRRRGPRRR